MHHSNGAIGFAPQHIGQGTTGLIGEASIQFGQALHAVQPKTPEVLAQLAPAHQRPHLTPEKTAQGPHRSLADLIVGVAVQELHHRPVQGGLAQALQRRAGQAAVDSRRPRIN